MANSVDSILVTAFFAVVLALTFVAWRRYLWASRVTHGKEDTNPYSVTDVFGDDHLLNVPHQKGVRWLTEIFSSTAKKFPDLTALQIPHTGESLTFAELDARAEEIAAAISPHLTGPDQVVAVAMSQDNWQIVASHLAILKAGGTLMFLDTTLPDAMITHMLNDARPVLVLTRGQDQFRDLPTLNVLKLPASMKRREPPAWLDDPTERLATIFYTSGTTGMPRGVECPHAGYVNLALSYADYFDLIPGMDATSLTSSLGYDGSHFGDVQRLGVRLRGCVADERRGPVRTGPAPCSLRSRSDGPLLSAGPAHNTHTNAGGRSSISDLPLYRLGGRSFPERPGRAMDSEQTTGHQYVRSDGGEHRYEPPEFAPRRTGHHRLALP